MNFKKTFFLLLISFTSVIYSQETPIGLVDKFFESFETAGPSSALDELYGTNKWISRSSDAISQLKTQLEGLNEDYVGKYYGKELLIERKLNENFVLMSYMVKYDRQPIRFTFQFYKPNDLWRIQSFSFDGDLDEEIKESAKLYYKSLEKK